MEGQTITLKQPVIGELDMSNAVFWRIYLCLALLPILLPAVSTCWGDGCIKGGFVFIFDRTAIKDFDYGRIFLYEFLILMVTLLIASLTKAVPNKHSDFRLNEKLEAERTHGDDEFVHEDLLAITLQPMLIMVSGDVARFRLAGMSKKGGCGQ